MLIVVFINLHGIISTTPLIHYDISSIEYYFSVLAIYLVNFSWLLFALKNQILSNITTVEKIKKAPCGST